MIRRMLVASVLVVSATAAFAQSNPIAERQQLMKNLSQASRAPGTMLKGETAFDLQVVQASLKTYADVAAKAPALFVQGAGSGETAALPAVYAKKADFDAKWAQFGKDATAAQASIKDEASLKATLPGVLRACGACHEDYRAKK